MTEHDTPTGSIYNELVNPHENDANTGEQHEALDQTTDSSERLREVVQYDPTTVPEISTQDISDTEDMIHQMYTDGASDEAVQSEVDRRLEGLGLRIDDLDVRENGTVIMRVKGDDGEIVRAVCFKPEDFGRYDNGVTVVELPHEENTIEDEQKVSDDQAERVDDALEDIADALGETTEEQTPDYEERRDQIKALEQYEERAVGYIDKLVALGQVENLGAVLTQFNQFRNTLEGVYLGLTGAYGTPTGMPDRETVEQLRRGIDRAVTMASTMDTAVIEGKERLGSVRTGMAEEKQSVDAHVRLDGEYARVDRLHNGLNEIAEGIEVAFGDMDTWRGDRGAVLNDTFRYIEDLKRELHHDQARHEFAIRMSQLKPKLDNIARDLTKIVSNLRKVNKLGEELKGPLQAEARKEFST